MARATEAREADAAALHTAPTAPLHGRTVVQHKRGHRWSRRVECERRWPGLGTYLACWPVPPCAERHITLAIKCGEATEVQPGCT